MLTFALLMLVQAAKKRLLWSAEIQISCQHLVLLCRWLLHHCFCCLALITGLWSLLMLSCSPQLLDLFSSMGLSLHAPLSDAGFCSAEE